MAWKGTLVKPWPQYPPCTAKTFLWQIMSSMHFIYIYINSDGVKNGIFHSYGFFSAGRNGVYCISIWKWLLHLQGNGNYANNYTVQIIIINFPSSNMPRQKPNLFKMARSSQPADLIWSLSAWLWDVLRAPWAGTTGLRFHSSDPRKEVNLLGNK